MRGGRLTGRLGKSVSVHLPLRAMRQAGQLDHETMTLLLTIGLIEEDARFGLVFEAAQGTPGQHRPTIALLCAWWRDAVDSGAVRGRLRRLQELGLVQAVNPDAPRMEWALQTPGAVWDALRGDASGTPARGRATGGRGAAQCIPTILAAGA